MQRRGGEARRVLTTTRSSSHDGGVDLFVVFRVEGEGLEIAVAASLLRRRDVFVWKKKII